MQTFLIGLALGGLIFGLAAFFIWKKAFKAGALSLKNKIHENNFKLIKISNDIDKKVEYLDDGELDDHLARWMR